MALSHVQIIIHKRKIYANNLFHAEENVNLERHEKTTTNNNNNNNNNNNRMHLYSIILTDKNSHPTYIHQMGNYVIHQVEFFLDPYILIMHTLKRYYASIKN